MRKDALPDIVVTHKGVGDGAAVEEKFADPAKPNFDDQGRPLFDEAARQRLADFEADAARRLTEPSKDVVPLGGYKYIQTRTHRDIHEAVSDVLDAPWGTTMYGNDVDAAEVTLPGLDESHVRVSYLRLDGGTNGS